MAWEWKRQSHETDEWSGFLESGIELEGKLASKGTFRVNCSIKGELASKVRLLLGPEADVEGQLDAPVVVIEGQFNGHAKGYERVDVKTSASVIGEITSPCVVIEPGAAFHGKCHVGRGDQIETVHVRPIESVRK